MPTYDEARIDYKNKMGEELGTAYHLLWNLYAQLHDRWHYYRALYCNSQADIDVMNRTAPRLFKNIHDVLWESVLLDLAKFCDPIPVRYRRPLSLVSLESLIPNGHIGTLRSCVSEMVAKTEFARDWRNRHIAHWDYAHALDHEIKPLQNASPFAVEEALGAIVRVLEAIESHFTGSMLCFDADPLEPRHLLNELKFVQQLRDERLKRLLDGCPTEDDMNWSKWNGGNSD
jgi:hypothetical protein